MDSEVDSGLHPGVYSEVFYLLDSAMASGVESVLEFSDPPLPLLLLRTEPPSSPCSLLLSSLVLLASMPLLSESL